MDKGDVMRKNKNRQIRFLYSINKNPTFYII